MSCIQCCQLVSYRFSYFVHDEQKGLAAFCSGEAPEAERNARFVSVGVLTQHDTVWVHAETLRDLAK